MLGLFLYTFLTFGLGALVPAIYLGGRRSIGSMLLVGYSLSMAAMFFFHAVLNVSLGVTFGLMLAGAGFGIYRLCRHVSLAGLSGRVSYPAIGLLLIGAVAIALNNGIDYLPYTFDEFANWIGISKQIYLGGSYDAVRDSINLLGYLPGWRLMLLLPWHVASEFSPGLSAAAPFVLHVAFVCLFFEIVRYELEKRFPEIPQATVAMSWGILMLYLAVEGTGKLWTIDLLIEQPQIYFLSAIVFYLYLIDTDDPSDQRLYIHAGISVMGAYLIKSAALALLPVLGLVLGLLFLRRSQTPLQFRILDACIKALILMGPLIAVALSWHAVLPDGDHGCHTSVLATFSSEALYRAGSLDSVDLFRRYTGAIFTYVYYYKMPVLAGALVGSLLLIWMHRTLALVGLFSFIFVYLGVIYWYHLTCFGPYYFDNLNSIERLVRVVLQPFHAIGLFGLAVGTLSLIPKEWVVRISAKRPLFGMFVAILVLLAGWQIHQVSRSVEEVSYRSYIPYDNRFIEVLRARQYIYGVYHNAENPPLVQYIAQHSNNDPLVFSSYLTLIGTFGQPRHLFEYSRSLSWNPKGEEASEQRKKQEYKLRIIFSKADIVWPIQSDEWLSGLVGSLAAGDDCEFDIQTMFLVKNPKGTFTCKKKPASNQDRIIWGP